MKVPSSGLDDEWINKICLKKVADSRLQSFILGETQFWLSRDCCYLDNKAMMDNNPKNHCPVPKCSSWKTISMSSRSTPLHMIVSCRTWRNSNTKNIASESLKPQTNFRYIYHSKVGSNAWLCTRFECTSVDCVLQLSILCM